MRFLSAKALVKNNTHFVLHVKALKNSGAIYKFKEKNSDPTNGWYKFFHQFKFGTTGYAMHFDKPSGRDPASRERSYFVNQFTDAVLGSAAIPLENGETLPPGLTMALETVQEYKKFTLGVI